MAAAAASPAGCRFARPPLLAGALESVTASWPSITRRRSLSLRIGALEFTHKQFTVLRPAVNLGHDFGPADGDCRNG